MPAYLILREIKPAYGKPVKVRVELEPGEITPREPESTARIFRALGCQGPEESVGFLFLNARNVIINYWVSSGGCVDECAVYPNAVLRRACLAAATGVIIAHNHPSGCVDPSPSDKALVRRMTKALSMGDVRLVDSLVLADNGSYFSFRKEGLMDRLTMD